MKVEVAKQYSQVVRSEIKMDKTEEELAFKKAIEQYKINNRRPYPTLSEVLEIAKSLGYRLVAEPTRIGKP